jgi:hypothetical protein
MAIAGEGSGLWIVDVVGIQVHVVGGMQADGGDGASALDAALVWVLYSLERKAKEVEEAGNDGWAPSGGECEDGDEPPPLSRCESRAWAFCWACWLGHLARRDCERVSMTGPASWAGRGWAGGLGLFGLSNPFLFLFLFYFLFAISS